jgi:hypothetical protein
VATILIDLLGIPCLEQFVTPIDLHKKKASAPRPGRLGAETAWGPALASSARSAPLAWARRTSGVQRQIGPLLFRPKFELAKKKDKKKHRGRARTPHLF